MTFLKSWKRRGGLFRIVLFDHVYIRRHTAREGRVTEVNANYSESKVLPALHGPSTIIGCWCSRPSPRTRLYIQTTCSQSFKPTCAPVLGWNFWTHCYDVSVGLNNCSIYSEIIWYRSEALYESDELPKAARDHAALVASKVYYFLGEYDEALSFALGAGSAFQAETHTYGSEEYVETIVCASHSLRFCFFKFWFSIIFGSQSYWPLYPSANCWAVKQQGEDRSPLAVYDWRHI